MSKEPKREVPEPKAGAAHVPTPAEAEGAPGAPPPPRKGTKAARALARENGGESAAGGSKGGAKGGGGEEEEGGVGAAGEMKVTVRAGPHAGVEARVLHVGNGWVKLLLPSGAVVHLRKWDLSGEVPLKVRSPAKGGGRAGG